MTLTQNQYLHNQRFVICNLAHTISEQSKFGLGTKQYTVLQLMLPPETVIKSENGFRKRLLFENKTLYMYCLFVYNFLPYSTFFQFYGGQFSLVE
jgi:hypothetical protein